MKNKKYNVVLPFHGFYESLHSHTIDHAIESLSEVNNKGEYEMCPVIFEYLNDHINYDAVRTYYASVFSDYASSELGFKCDFVLLQSPTYYNYLSDKIVVKINKKAIKSICKHVLKNCAQDFRDIMQNSGVVFHPITYKGFKNIVNPTDDGNYLNREEYTIVDTLLRLYIADVIPENWDFDSLEYDLGQSDNLSEFILSTLDADELSKYNSLVDTESNNEVTQ